MATARRRVEEGFSLIEVLIASALTLVVLMMGYEVLDSSTATAKAISTRSVNSANAREAIDALEANLRSASGAWACAGLPTTTTCATPAGPSTVATWSRATTATYGATLFVTNASGGTQPTCDEWTISTAGLVESHVSGTTVTTIFSVPGVMAWVPPLATAVAPASTAQTPGFSSAVSGALIEIDLLVNSVATTSQSAAVFDTADAVSVHDFIAPDNLPTPLTSFTSFGNC